jgi:hypothetical protein
MSQAPEQAFSPAAGKRTRPVASMFMKNASKEEAALRSPLGNNPRARGAHGRAPGATLPRADESEEMWREL